MIVITETPQDRPVENGKHGAAGNGGEGEEGGLGSEAINKKQKYDRPFIVDEGVCGEKGPKGTNGNPGCGELIRRGMDNNGL